MRWFLTNTSPLEDELRAAGEEVVSSPEDWQATHLPWLAELAAEVGPGSHRDPITRGLELRASPAAEETGNYRLYGRLQDRRPEVVVLTPMHEPTWGFPKGPISKWRNMQTASNRRILVGVGQDPQTMEAAKHGGYRGCACTVGILDVYVTDSLDAARWSARDRRTVLWAPGWRLEPLIQAVAEAVAGQSYAAGPRAVPWGI